MSKKNKNLIGKTFLAICGKTPPRLIRGRIVEQVSDQEAYYVTLIEDSIRNGVATVVMDRDVLVSLLKHDDNKTRTDFDNLLQKCGEAMRINCELGQMMSDADVNPPVRLVELHGLSWYSKSADGAHFGAGSFEYDQQTPF